MPAVQMPVPICLNPNISLAPLPLLTTHTNTHSRCHIYRSKLALLLTLAVLGSCGIGHGNQGYCLPHTNHSVCVFTFINRIVKISHMVPPPVNPNPLFFLMKDLLWPILKASPALSSVDTLAQSPPFSQICCRYPAGGDFTAPQSQSQGFVICLVFFAPRSALLFIAGHSLYPQLRFLMMRHSSHPIAACS